MGDLAYCAGAQLAGGGNAVCILFISSERVGIF